MTISNTNVKMTPAEGDGVNTSFPFDFPVFNKEELRVVFTNDLGVNADLVLDVDYSVTLNSDQSANPGGTILYPLAGLPMAAGHFVTLLSNAEGVQEANLVQGGGWLPEVIERALDRAMIVINQATEAVSRSIKFSETEAPTVDKVTLPPPVANAAIGWNAAGNGLTNVSVLIPAAVGSIPLPTPVQGDALGWGASADIINIDVVTQAELAAADVATRAYSDAGDVADQAYTDAVDAINRTYTDAGDASTLAAAAAAAASASGAIPLATMDAAGDLIVGTGNDTVGRLAIGTTLQQLRVNAGGTALEWGSYASDAALLATADTAIAARDVIALADAATASVQKSLVDAAGDLLVGTANDTVGRLAMGTTLQQLRVNAGATALEWAAPSAVNDKKSIYGLTYANNVTDAANDIDIAAGGCMDNTGTYFIEIAAITKQLDAAWAVGTNQGGRDTGAIANGDWYIWAIARSDTGVCDVLFSLSSTAPTMPANYDKKRLIGWFERASIITTFKTYETEGGGIDFLWRAPTLDINLANTLTTSRRFDAVRVPLTFSTVAKLNIVIADAAASIVWIYSPDQSDAAPDFANAPLVTAYHTTAGTATAAALLFIRTNTAGQIAARANVTLDAYRVSTLGFNWSRRN